MQARIALSVLIVLMGAGGAARAAERLDGEAIRKAFEGHTVAGRYAGTNRPFSDHHHPDGRATGHNRGVPNTDACWTTTADSVCYYYGPRETRRTYCFTVERSERLYILRRQPGGEINAMGTVAAGDTEGASAGAPAWSCDGLISAAPPSARLARR